MSHVMDNQLAILNPDHAIEQYVPKSPSRQGLTRMEESPLAQVSQISPKSSDFRPSGALEALILRGVAFAAPLWADLGC